MKPLAEMSPRLEIRPEELYREEVFTARGAASIRRLVPVRPDGSADATRVQVYVGETHAETDAGLVPVRCELPARSLEEALRVLPEALERVLARSFRPERARSLRLQALA